MNSFIPWIGGKSQSRKIILAEFPKEPLKRYVEVFGGAGWILFSKEKHASIEVFNDADGNLINLYRCIQHHCGELQREIKMGGELLTPVSRELFFDYLEQINCRGLTDIQRAARYFYIIRASYGADRRTFGCKPMPLLSVASRLPEIQQRIKEIVIENRDFEGILKTYGKRDSLCYLDPPYYDAESYYAGFEPKDHDRLFDCVSQIKGLFILSYNDTPEIRQKYKDYLIIPFERSNNLAHKKGAGTASYKELIIKNF